MVHVSHSVDACIMSHLPRSLSGEQLVYEPREDSIQIQLTVRIGVPASAEPSPGTDPSHASLIPPPDSRTVPHVLEARGKGDGFLCLFLLPEETGG